MTENNREEKRESEEARFKVRKLGAIWQTMRGERLRYLGAIGALVVASCFLYLSPMVPQIVLDGVIAKDPKHVSGFAHWVIELMGGRDYIRSHLWVPGVLIVLFTSLAGVFTYLRGRWSARSSEAITRRLRDRVYDHLQHLPCRYFDNAATGDLVQRCTSDVETVRMFLATQVVEIGRATAMLLIPLPLMWSIDVRMTIASVILIPLIVAFSMIFFVRVKKAFKAMDEAEGHMTSCVQENLTGIRVVRAFARQDFEIEKFENRNRKHRDLDRGLYNVFAMFWGFSDFLCFLQIGLVVILGAFWLAKGELQVGAFFYFLTAVTMFIFPVRMMGRVLSDLGKATVSLGRIEEILEEPEESASDEEKAMVYLKALEGEIKFDHVTFSHGTESPVLRDVSFRIEAGKTLAILGPSGCGKSTIVNLLLRLYDYDEGRILLDGHALQLLDRQFVRSQMAVVMQEPFLFSKSLRENLKLGKRLADDKEMLEATSVACVHESILEFDEGYDTVVGERGATLSGGQRQRVALARALLQDPAVLILDDALSAVDTETETEILDALKRRRGAHTTIAVAHRLSTVMNADQIIVLDHGRIVQSGTHRELVNKPGLYRRLWKIQGAVDDDDVEGAGAMAVSSD